MAELQVRLTEVDVKRIARAVVRELQGAGEVPHYGAPIKPATDLVAEARVRVLDMLQDGPLKRRRLYQGLSANRRVHLGEALDTLASEGYITVGEDGRYRLA